jgi:ferredoxin-NADP reductase
MKARLLETREIGPGIRHFVFEVESVPALEFTPGQFVSFSEVIGDRRITRAYSLCSVPSGNRFELCLNRVQDGIFSPWLFRLKPGDELPMRGPLGYFVPRDPFRDSVFIATGTGIAPFRGFLLSKTVTESPSAITLLFGARYESGLIYRAEFEDLAANRPGFLFLPTLTRPEEGWHGRTGRVQQHLDAALAGRTNLDIYICGLKAMVDDVRELLKEHGFDRKQVFYEKYD